jgi:serine/threonine protein kinase/formylglycine-generating enzyme required for sulfatase activity
MSDAPKPGRTERPPLQQTLDTLGSAGQPAEHTAPGPPAPPPLPSTTADVPPELAGLQGYEIVKELGRGGMGVVYLAHNRLMDRPEVLKVMSKALVGQPAAVERFLREIRSAARLDHPNAVTAHSAHQLGDLLVLSMQYVDGEDLARVVRERGALPVAHACYCAHQAALALQRGHELGLVHRDIKPGNLLLAKQGKRPVVKLIDFGLAKARSEVAPEQELTGTNQMMGTPGYTAPEQLLDAKHADTRSDIYSLGCTLYCLLAGKSPFQGKTSYAILLAQQAGEIRPLREARPEVPEGLATVVTKMMAKDPAARFQTPGEVARALVPFISPPKEAPAKAGGSGQQPVASPGEARPAVLLPETGSSAGITHGGATPSKRRPKAKPSKASRRVRGGKRMWLAAVGAVVLLAGVVILGAFVLRVKTPNGTVVIENVPSGAEARVDGEVVTVSRNGDTLTIATLPEGPHRLKVTLGGREILSSDVTVKFGREPVRLRAEPTSSAAELRPVPTPATGGREPDGAGGSKQGVPQVRERPKPLDCTGPDGVSAADVRRAQEAWAAYLGRQVEETVDIADGVKVTFVLVPPGKFRMGSPETEANRSNDEALHTVVLTEPFDLGKTEVTQAQYKALTGKEPSKFKGSGDLPVEQVSWEEARDYGVELTKKLSDKHAYRLPTEAEWEYACRGGRPSSQAFGIGDGRSLSSRDANFNGTEPYGGAAKGDWLGKTTKVGFYAANALGLYDMHGNVWEWCADTYGPYPTGEVTNPTGPTEGPDRVIRGGGWVSDGRVCRAAYHGRFQPGYRDSFVGFRLARSVPSGGK